METVRDFIFGGSKITADADCSHEIKRSLVLGRKAMTNLDSILKSRDITLPTKVSIIKAFSIQFSSVAQSCPTLCNPMDCSTPGFPVHQSWFPSGRARMWESDYKESWIDAFELWCWRRLLRVSWTARRSNQSILKEISPEYSLEGLMLKLQYFGHLMWRTDSFQKTWCLERLKAGEGDDKGWDGWMANHPLNGHEFE